MTFNANHPENYEMNTNLLNWICNMANGKYVGSFTDYNRYKEAIQSLQGTPIQGCLF